MNAHSPQTPTAAASAGLHAIDDVVRTINPDTFSGRHPGHRVVLVDKRAGPYRKRVLDNIFGRRTQDHYFVRQWTVPKAFEGWAFRWTEGTNAISLDFEARFVIQANEEVQAFRLVEALSSLSSPGEALYNLIHAALNEELDRLLAESNRKALSLLDIFRRSSIGMGESDELDAKVGQRVREALGGATFRIGFQLRNVPPMQVEVRRIGDKADPFTLADSRRQRLAETTALLKLDNYQAFKRSGLQTEEDVRAAIGRAITETVKELLFARKYYDVVRHFKLGEDAIEKQMRRRIEEEARTIGYGVKMFQSLPDIEALKLLEPVRIDIAATEEKYDLKNSVGYVRFSVSLMAQAEGDISRLHLLIDPDAKDVVGTIAARVRQICRDTMLGFDHLQFNLHFEDEVVPALEEAICRRLAECGLAAQIIHIRQAPTEEGQRFKAIRGRTADFSALIKPHANRGQADAVPVAGTIEVVGMAEAGWEPFQSKDFGYRDDAHVTQERMRQMAENLNLPAPSAGPWSEAERRSLAIDLELAEIRQRVTRVLEGQMAMGPDLADHWTTASNNRQIGAWAQKVAAEAIASEFGLSIEIRAFRRLDTEADVTTRITREAHHAVVREAARGDAEGALAYERREREAHDTNHIELIARLGRRERDALDDPDSEEGQAVAERVRKTIETASQRPRLTSERALTALQNRPATTETKELPWAPPEGG